MWVFKMICTIMNIIAIIILSGIALLFLLMIIDKFSKNVWFCNVMGWHKSPETMGFDGCSLNGTCPRCDKKVLRDSQGNWF